MWTPRRILIFLVALVGFGAAFGVYSVFVVVDPLPPLPQQYLPGDRDVVDILPKEDDRERRVRQAFGNECEELKRNYIVSLASKGMVLAIDKYDFEKAVGKVTLRPFSVAIFAKDKPNQRFPEINVVQCEEADLTLDRPISSLLELGKSKVIAVVLGGKSGVKIVNNRGTPEKSDDLELFLPRGNLYYEEARSVVWTDDYVKLLDTQSKPLPTQVTAVGLDLHLAKRTAPKEQTSTKNDDAFSGVEKLSLRSNVDMHLYVEGRTGFLDGSGAFAGKAASAKPGEKTHLHVKTTGKFVYDVVRNFARFEAPEKPGATASDRVLAVRETLGKAPVGTLAPADHLECDLLDLQFRNKGPKGNEKDIELAVASAHPKQIVELRVESEELRAFAAEMRYFSATPESGPRTILKGAPVSALRQGHQIECAELHLKAADKNGVGQESFAKGPGRIDLLDKQTGRHTMHIEWRNSLTSTKDRDGDRVFDLLTLRGDAVVREDDRAQELRAGQFLHLWVEEVKAPAKGTPDAKAGPRQRPHKIEAFENVTARSPELIIRKANHLTVCFRDVPADRLPDAIPAVGAGPAPAVPTATPNNNPPAMLLGPNVHVPASKEPPRSRKPVELTANEITAYVAESGPKKHLLELVTEGDVHIVQAPESPKDKGVEVSGTMLNLVRQPKGDVLHVFGEARKLAQIQFGEMALFGPKVTVDQGENMAMVEGIGAMQLPSNKTLDGKAKESRIAIHWNKSMWFNGASAYFEGGVEAFQESAKLRCQEMQVTLDRPVDFKQGMKAGQKPAVDKIVCHNDGKKDQSVLIIDEERGASGKVVAFRRLQLLTVEADNKEQRLNGSGPGVLDFVAKGNPADPKAKTASPPPETEMRWTRVRFVGQVVSYPTETGRMTTFLEQVRVFHQPGEDPNQRDPAVLGPDGLYMTCHRLSVATRKVGERTTKEMSADGGPGLVNFQTPDISGNAKVVKYDEGQEVIVFEGAPAVIYKRSPIQGARPQQIQGNKILYNKKTGEFLLDGVRVISSWLTPLERELRRRPFAEDDVVAMRPAHLPSPPPCKSQVRSNSAWAGERGRG